MKTLLVLATAASCLCLAACNRDYVDHDERVGRTKTTTKQTIDTPEGKKTYTETREKNTTITPK